MYILPVCLMILGFSVIGSPGQLLISFPLILIGIVLLTMRRFSSLERGKSDQEVHKGSRAVSAAFLGVGIWYLGFLAYIFWALVL